MILPRRNLVFILFIFDGRPSLPLHPAAPNIVSLSTFHRLPFSSRGHQWLGSCLLSLFEIHSGLHPALRALHFFHHASLVSGSNAASIGLQSSLHETNFTVLLFTQTVRAFGDKDSFGLKKIKL